MPHREITTAGAALTLRPNTQRLTQEEQAQVDIALALRAMEETPDVFAEDFFAIFKNILNRVIDSPDITSSFSPEACLTYLQGLIKIMDWAHVNLERAVGKVDLENDPEHRRIEQLLEVGEHAGYYAMRFIGLAPENMEEPHIAALLDQAAARGMSDDSFLPPETSDEAQLRVADARTSSGMALQPLPASEDRLPQIGARHPRHGSPFASERDAVAALIRMQRWKNYEYLTHEPVMRAVYAFKNDRAATPPSPQAMQRLAHAIEIINVKLDAGMTKQNQHHSHNMSLLWAKLYDQVAFGLVSYLEILKDAFEAVDAYNTPKAVKTLVIGGQKAGAPMRDMASEALTTVSTPDALRL